ncbi:MAG: hypothetical protein H2069_03465 [Legionella sp.]|nr:hypothetical protein [Legionella sp.]
MINSVNSCSKQLNHQAMAFTLAIQKYLQHPQYKRLEKLTSFFIVFLQVSSLLQMLHSYIAVSYLSLITILLLAYIATDFINGLVHMYMDNNTHYSSCIGPFIAAFHLHHAKYTYRVRHPLRVYFDESGTKFWLLGYLFLLVIFPQITTLDIRLHIGLVAFGIFSSIAELSHYWCHNATKKNRLVLWLQKTSILLSKKHHAAHHCSDNVQYAFLNGLTDPLINKIAHVLYKNKGYKNYADQHTKIYLKQTGFNFSHSHD